MSDRQYRRQVWHGESDSCQIGHIGSDKCQGHIRVKGIMETLLVGVRSESGRCQIGHILSLSS